MCPKPAASRLLLRTRWWRARARLFVYVGHYHERFRDSKKVQVLTRTAFTLLRRGMRDENLTEEVMARVEKALDELWQAYDWQTRFREFREHLGWHAEALQAFDSMIQAGCYPDLIVAGVREVASRESRWPLPGRWSQQARERATGLSRQCKTLAVTYEAAAHSWPGTYPPIFKAEFAKTLRDEANRLDGLRRQLDRRHRRGVRPLRLTLFLSAMNHVKDVTGTYHDNDFALTLDGLRVNVQGDLVDSETVRKWRLRERAAEAGDPHRPLIARMRELWD